jgi:hypothetical protein
VTLREAERVPRALERCPRCHRSAPRSDGIPCRLCAPRGRSGITFTDSLGITHAWLSSCALSRDLDRELNVGDVPVTCMTCVAEPAIQYADEDEPW